MIYRVKAGDKVPYRDMIYHVDGGDIIPQANSLVGYTDRPPLKQRLPNLLRVIGRDGREVDVRSNLQKL